MGQKVGKASFDERAKPFLNLPREAIRALWQEFNLCADGWGVDPVFFDQLCQAITTSMGTEFNEKAAQALFAAFDTDKNKLVDGLELISTVGMLSGMTRGEKVEFVFACYDVGGRSSLSTNELFLLLKSTCTGLCKLSGIDTPHSARLESVASLVFTHNKREINGGLPLVTLSSYCDTNPVACSWLAFYDDCEGQDWSKISPEDPGGESANPSLKLEMGAPDIYREDGMFKPRSQRQENANIGEDEGVPTLSDAPTGPWVESAKELIQPQPAPEEDEEPADDEAGDEDGSTAGGAGAAKSSLPPPPPPPAPPAPDVQLSLEWVYGYSATASRSSVYYSASSRGNSAEGGAGEGFGVVYPAGKVAVVLSQPVDDEGVEMEGDRVQSFLQEHTDEITALAVSPCGQWVATGEAGANPKVVVWNASSKQIRNAIAGFHRMGVASLAWSPCGDLLASVGADVFHSLQVVRVDTGEPVFSARTGRSRPLGMAWSADGKCLVTCGQTHKDSPPLVFWVKEASTGSFVKKRGIAGVGKIAPSIDIQLCICAAPGVKASKSSGTPLCMISGTLGGGLCLWRGRNCCKAIADAHSAPVETLSAGEARGGVLASGGGDGKVKLWSGIDLAPLATLDVMATPSVAGLRQIRSVCLSSDATKVLVGTLGSDILELSAVEMPKNSEDEEEPGANEEEEGEGADGANARTKPSGIGRVLNDGKPLACGHCEGELGHGGIEGELRSVDVSSQGDQFVTGGDDGTVRAWSNAEKKCIRTLNLGSPVLSVAYSPDASLIAVGLQGGGVSILKLSEDDPSIFVLEKSIDGFKSSATSATCVRFSPTSAVLAAGGGDGTLKIWGTSEREWEAAGSCEQLVPGSIVSMDFTTEGGFVMINSTTMDMAIANVETCTKASLKELKILRSEGESGEVAAWATSTCTMTNGKQAAWASMRPDGDTDTYGTLTTGTGNMLTGSDIVKGGEQPVLLASDALGRIGILRYPAELPKTPTISAFEPASDDPNAPVLGEEEILAAKVVAAEQAEAMVKALDAAIPRACMVKAHARKVAATRHIGEGGQALSLGAADRCVYQWTVGIDDGEESGEDMPDTPACNAPQPKHSGEEEDEEGGEDEGDGDDEGENAKVEAWSGDDEDLVDAAGKPWAGLTNEGQGMSGLVPRGNDAEQAKLSNLPWLEGSAAGPSQCVPDEDLELEWIHGYSAQGSRQNLVYNRNGEIVYPAACAGVVLTKYTQPVPHKQAFHLDHSQAISCLAIHPDKAYVATGQEGPCPLVLVWDSTCKGTITKARLELGEDKTGASQVCFSADGKLLAVACEDRSHTVMVFRWESGILRCQARAGAKKALSLCFSLKADELLAAGYKHFKVWTVSAGGLMQGKRGLFGSGSKIQALTCASAMSNEEGGSSFVLGGSSGNILKLEGRRVSTPTEAHEGAVYAMYAYPAADGSGSCLVTGGSDGKIKTWDSELAMTNEFDLVGRPYLWGANPCVRSVCVNDHSDGRKILIGTACSEILEISATDGTDVNGGDCLIKGHFRDQLWGLTAHPAKAIYCSSGDEGTLKEWDVATLALKRQIDLEGWVRCVQYSPNGLLVACGMGGETDGMSSDCSIKKRHSPREEDGTIKIVSGMEEAFRVVNILSDATGPITCIRFSPDGNRMAAASLDGNAYIYSVLENFKLECIGEANQGGMLRLDFSSDGKWIRAESRSKEPVEADLKISITLLSAESGDVSADHKVVDTENGFATWSGLCADPAAGLWSPDATSPQAVRCCSRSAEGGLLATAEAKGDLKLFRYPARGRFASFKAFKAHSADARGVCFVGKGKGKKSQHVVSVGGKDRCVMQWKLIHSDPSSTTSEEASAAAHPEEDPWVQAELSSLEKMQIQKETSFAPRPWETGPGLKESAPRSDASAPDGVALELECAIGYNTAGQARNNLGFSATGRVILPCGSVGVVYDKASHSQVLFTRHSGRVVSLAVSICGRFVATGQEGRDATAMIWDPATGHQKCLLPTSSFGSVRRLSFSPDGLSLCGIGADRDNCLCVWASASGTWVDGARVAFGQGPRRAPLFVTWTGGDVTSPYQVMTGGQNYVTFWKLQPNLSSRLGKERGVRAGEGAISADPSNQASSALGGGLMAQTFLCGVVVGSTTGGPSVVVTGTASGSFAVWENFECVRMLPGAHGSSAVLCLSPTPSGGFVSGGADGEVRLWDESFNVKELPVTIPKAASSCDAIRAVTVNRNESNMAVGTSSGRVIEISLDSGDTSIIVDGPAAASPSASVDGFKTIGSRSAVAHSPGDPDIYVTGASDGYLRKWSASGRRLITKTAVGSIQTETDRGDGRVAPASGVGIGGDGADKRSRVPGIGALRWASGATEFVLCGLSSGDVVLVSPIDMTVLSRCPSNKKPTCAVTAAAISPSAASVTVGCEDGSLHGLVVSPHDATVQHAWSTSGAGAAVMAMDVSEDGKTIRYCDASGHLSYATNAGVPIDTAPPGDSNPATWNSSTCFVGHWGVRAASSAGCEATASARSNHKKRLAATTEGSSVRLWRYPAAEEDAAYVEGETVPVGTPAALVFTGDDCRLIAVGGDDGSILQWTVSK